MFFYLSSKVYTVKLPLALINIPHLTESILHSHMTMPKIHNEASIYGFLALPHSDDA